MTSPEKADTTGPKRIWLSPSCDEERTWCQDNQGPCDDCGLDSVEYVRADLVAALSSQITQLTEERDRAIRGLDEERHASSVAMQATAVVQERTEAERDRLREALKPFALAAEDVEDEQRETADIFERAAALSITVGDLRRAAALQSRVT